MENEQDIIPDVDLMPFWIEVEERTVFSMNVPIFECLERRCPFLRVNKECNNSLGHPDFKVFHLAHKSCSLDSIPCPLQDYTEDHQVIIKYDWMEGALKWIAAKMLIDFDPRGFSSVSKEMLDAFRLLEGYLNLEVFIHKNPFRHGSEFADLRDSYILK